MPSATRLVALALVAAAAPALAAPTPAERKQARAHYDAAVNHFNAGEYPAAAEEFLAVYKIAPQPVLLYDVAQAYRLGGDGAHALAYYKQFLHEAPAAAAARAEVERRVAALERRAGKTAPPDLGAPVTPVADKTAAKPKAGGSDRFKAIVEVIKAHRPAFRDCFDKWSRAHPGISGKVTLTFYLDPEGMLDQPEAATSGFDAPDVAACIEEASRKLTWPKSPSGKFTRFSYPFDFKASR